MTLVIPIPDHHQPRPRYRVLLILPMQINTTPDLSHGKGHIREIHLIILTINI
jgi:hypothetical protein